MLTLVNQAFLIGANALAEHVVRPTLVDEHDRDEDQGDHRHDRQRVLRGGSVVNRPDAGARGLPDA